jgi:hypothetical protein
MYQPQEAKVPERKFFKFNALIAQRVSYDTKRSNSTFARS